MPFSWMTWILDIVLHNHNVIYNIICNSHLDCQGTFRKPAFLLEDANHTEPPMPVPAARVFVAIDTMDRASAKEDAARLGPGAGGLKLGLEFFVANGPDGIRDVAGTTPLFL